MKNSRKCLYLCAGMALLLLAACGRRPAQGTAAPAAPAAETKTEELPDNAQQAMPVPEPEPTAAPQPEAFTDAQALGDFSEGLAFALVTLPDGEQRYAYITRQGEIAFTLPDGYTYGWPFHEGYAAVCDADCRTISSSDPLEEYAAPERHYNLVNEQGELCFAEDTYCFIGTVGEGKVLTRSVKEDHNGTDDTIAFRDLDENIVWEFDSESYLDTWDEMTAMPWRSFYQNGTVWLFVKTSFGTVSHRFDGSGIELEDAGAGWEASTWLHPEWYFTTESRQISESNWALQKHFYAVCPATGEKVELYGIPEEYENYLPHNVPFCNDRILGLKSQYGDGFYIFDRSGAIVAEKDEPTVTSVAYDRSGVDGHWIVSMANDYSGVLDTNGDLAFEPVQGLIYYMGGGLYGLDREKKIVDVHGDTVCELPAGCDFQSATGISVIELKPVDYNSMDGCFHEGLAAVFDAGVRRFMDKNGDLLTNASDFAASPAA